MKKNGKKAAYAIRRMLPLIICLMFSLTVRAQQTESVAGATTLVVKNALMCEGVQDGLPVNQTIIFDTSNASAYCWTEFDPVPADGFVYHEWYRKGILITRKKLAVHSPRWTTYSRLPLRKADIGPWHLNITDEKGNVMKTLRFSITE